MEEVTTKHAEDTKARAKAPTRLFCWSGGGLPGLDIHVGIWKALAEAGIYSTANAGTSAGAVVGALNSAGWYSFDAEGLLRGLHDRDVRAERLWWKVRLPWLISFMLPDPIQKLLSELLPDQFEELLKPLCVVARREADGQPAEFRSGARLRDAVLASLSIAGVWPPVEFAQALYSDGGTTASLPLPKGWQEFDEVWLLVASRPLEYRRHGKSALSRLLYNADLLITDQVRDTIELAQASHRKVRVLWPPVAETCSALHFDHRLIETAYTWTCAAVAKVMQAEASGHV